MATTGTISSTAGGSISITGTGGAGTDVNGGNSGISIVQNQGLISTTSGTITLTGTGGGTGASPYNYGVQISTTTGAPIVSSVSGNILVTGIGGNTSGSGGANTGIYVNVSNAIQTTGSGSIILKGIKGGQSNSVGIAGDAANAYVTTGTGSISAYTDTIYLSTVNTINSAGVLTIAPYTNGSMGVGYSTGYTLNLTDTVLGYINGASYVFGSTVAGNGVANTSDVVINTTKNFADKNVSFISGRDLYLWGNLTKSSGTGTVSYLLQANGNISNTSTISGISATSGAVNIILNSDYDQATSAGGSVYLNGGTFNTNGGSLTIGGGTNPLTGNSYISNSDAVTIGTTTTVTTGAGNIYIRGENTGTSGSAAVLIAGTVTTTTGTISIYGKSTANNTSSRGIIISGSAVMSTGSGDITLTGINSSGNAGGYAFLLFNTGTTGGTISSTSGNILIDATRGSNETGFGLSTSNTSTPAISAANGNITILTDTKYMAATGTQISAANGTLTIAPKTNVTMSLGASGGTLYFSGADLAQFTAANYVFGSTIGGNLTVGTSRNFGDSNVTFRSGGDINLSANLAKTSGTAVANYIFQAYGNIYNSTNAGVSATTGSINLTLQSDYDGNSDGAIALTGGTFNTNGGNITMGGGSSAITAGSGYAWSNATYISGITISSATIQAAGGNIIMNGSGRVNPASDSSYGIRMLSATVSTTGNGNISLNGVGGGSGSTSGNHGIQIRDLTTVSAVNGDITFTGKVTETGNTKAISMGNATVQTTGTGSINFIDTGTLGTGFEGFLTTNNVISGNNLTYIGHGFLNVVNAWSWSAVNTITIKAYTAGMTMGIGSGAGTFSVTDLNLAKMTAANFVFGSVTTGDVTINTARDFGTKNLTFISGNDINLAGTLTKSTGTIRPLYTFQAYRNIYNSNNAGITATTGTLSVLMQSDYDGNNDGAVSLVGGSISTGGGHITIGGGTGTVSTGFGYAVGNATYASGVTISTTLSANGGHIVINGRGANLATSGNNGVNITSSISTINTGNIAINGIGSGNTDSGVDLGVQISSGAVISAVDGNITLVGTAGGAGTGAGNYGINIVNGGTTVRTTGAGSLVFTGIGGNNTGSGANNWGIYVSPGSSGISTTGTGNITLTGTGSSSSGGSNYGMNIGSITANGGSLTLVGTGGASTGNNNYGIVFNGTVSGLGSSIVTFTGNGGGAVNSSYNYGILVNGLSTNMSANGAFNVTGTGGGAGSGFNNYGVYVTYASGLKTTGSGNLTVTGYGGNLAGTGFGNQGVYNATASGVLTTGSGSLIIKGVKGSGSSVGVYGTGANAYSTTGTGNITVFTDSIFLNTANTINSIGTVTMATYSNGSLGVGYSSGYTFNLDNTTLNYINGASYVFGSTVTGTGAANTSNMAINTTKDFVDKSVTFVSGQDINIAGNFTKATGTGTANYLFQANRNIYNSGSSSISATTGLMNLTLQSDYDGNSDGAINLANGTISTNGGNITLGGGSGTITAGSGYAVGNATYTNGIFINTALDAGGGNIIANAKSYLSSANGTYGLLASAAMSTTGNGTISLNGVSQGTGNAGTGYGLYLMGLASTVNGNIYLTGTGGGAGTGSDNYGVVFSSSGGAAKTTGTGNIIVNGTGGTGGGGSNLGVLFNGPNGIQFTGTGTATVTGTGGLSAGNSNYGVSIAGALTLTGNNITINGTGGAGTGGANMGILIGAGLSNTGTGTITLNGTGGGSTNSASNYGIYIQNSAVVSTVDGALNIVGVGGGAGTGASNYGIQLNTSAVVKTTGAGALNVTGTGGNSAGSGANNYGILINTGTTLQTTGTGTMTVLGTGSNSSGTNNSGVYVSGTISGAGGIINITGNGGTGAAPSHGVIVVAGTVSNTGSGIVNITGTGGGTGASSGSYGVLVYTGGVVSTVNGAINVTGTGGTGSGGSNRGVAVTSSGASTIKTTGSGSIVVKGAGGSGSNSNGIFISGVSDGVQTTGTGNITLLTDNLVLNTANAVESVGSLTIAVLTNGATMGVGSGAGTLSFTDALKAFTVAGSYIYGSTTTGDLTINTAYNYVDRNVTFISGSNINLAGALTKATGTGTANYLFQAYGSIYNTNSAGMSATTGAINLTLQSDYDANSDGAINLTGGTFATNGGNITIGGGAGTITAGSGFAYGNASNPIGANIGSNLSAGGGNIIINAASYTTAGAPRIGVCITNATVSTTGAGTITINGIGTGVANAGGNNIGVWVVNSGVVSTQNGLLSITGTDQTTGTGNSWGVYVSPGGTSTVKTTGSGDINITGNSRAGSASASIAATVANAIQTTGTGNIVLKGLSGTGIYVTSSNAINTASGTITTYSDTYSIAAANGINSGNALNMNTYTNRGMSIGAAVAGTTNIDNTSVANVQAATTYIFGSTVTGTGTSNTGDITINTTRDFGAGHVNFVSGGNINLAGTLTKATGAGTAAYLFQANGNITNTNSAGISATTGAVNLTMTSDNDISGAGDIVLTTAPLLVNGGTITLNSNGQTITQSGTIGGAETINSNNGAVSIGVLNADVASTRDLTVNAGTATLTTTGAIGGTAQLKNVTFTADDVVLGANIAGSGTLTLQPYTISRVINVNSGTANGTNFNLSTAEIANLVNGWSQIIVGRADGSAIMTLGSSAWVDPITFRAFAKIATNSGSIISTSDNAPITFYALWVDAAGTINSANSVTFNTSNAYGYVSYGSTVTATNSNITFTNNVRAYQGNLTLNAGTGTITLPSGVNTNTSPASVGSYDFTATAGSFSFGNAIGNALAPLGNVTLNSVSSISLPAITTAAGKTVNITVTGAGSSITTTGVIATGAAGNITLTADDLILGADLSGTGTITLQQNATNRIMNVAGGASDGTNLNLSVAEIAHLVDGWSQIYLGRADGTAVNTYATSTWRDPVTFRNNAKIATVGTITTIDNAPLTIAAGAGYVDAFATINSAGAVTINTGSFGYISYGSVINTTNSNITFSNNVRAGYTSTDPGSLTLNAGTGTITLPNGVNNQSVAASYDFTATAGSFVIGAALGGTTALGNVTLNSINSITLPAITTAAGKTVNVTVTGAGNSITTTGSIATGAAGNITLTADDLILGGNLSGTGIVTLQPYATNRIVNVNFGTANGTNFNLSTAEIARLVDGWSLINIGNIANSVTSNYGDSTWADPVNFRSDAGRTVFALTGTGNASFTFSGSQSWVDLYGNITTNGGAVDMGNISYLYLAPDGVTAKTISTFGGNILNRVIFLSGQDLTLNAGTGTINFNGAVQGGHNLTATADSIIFTSGWGGTTSLGNVSLTAANSLILPTLNAASVFVRTTGATSDISIGSGNSITASGSGNAITLVSGRNFINNSGSATPLALTGSGRYLVYSASPAADSLNGMTSGFVRYGCTYSGGCPTGTTIAATGNGLIYAYQPTLTITPTAINTIYGNTVPSLAGYGYSVSGYLNANDSGSNVLSGSLTGSTSYVQGNDVGAYNLDYSSGTLTSSLGYAIVYANNTSGINVGQRTLNVTLTGVISKTYDGTDAVTLASGNYSLDDIYGSDLLTISNTSGTYNDKNAGTGKNVTVNGLTLSGAKASNYVLSSTTTTGAVGTVLQKVLNIIGVGADNKVYDATKAATLNGTAALSGIIGSENVTVGGTALAEFNDKNVGTAKSVTVSGYTLSGADASNYSVNQPIGITANVTPKALTVSGLSVSDKVYDGSVTAALNGAAALSGLLGTDNVILGGTGAGSFADKNVGVSKAVTVSGYTISGTDANNYSLDQPTGITANVTAKTLTVSGLSTSDKVYDGSVTAALNGAAALSGLLGTDNVILGGIGAGSFVDKNVGVSKAVTVSGYTISGTDAANYDFVQPTGLVATITQKLLTLVGLGVNNKVYDGTAVGTINGTIGFSGIVGSDVVNLTGTGVATFDNKNAGVMKSVTISGYTTSGTDAANYNFVQPTGVTANVTQKALTVTADNKTITYGTAVPTGTISYSGFVSGENASNLTTAPIVTSTASGIKDAQTYTGNYVASGGADNNYSFTYVSGNLIVQQRALTIVTDNFDNTSGTLAPVFTGSNNLLAADAALISWTYAPIGYTIGDSGIYTIGATANDPSGRLNNYIRTNNYGIYNVGVAPPPPVVPGPTIPPVSSLPPQIVSSFAVGVPPPFFMFVEIPVYSASGEVVSTSKEWIAVSDKQGYENPASNSNQVMVSYSDELKYLLDVRY